MSRRVDTYYDQSDVWKRLGRPDVGPPISPNPPGFNNLIQDEQFATYDPAAWHIYDNSTFGANGGRIQRYMGYNAVFGAGSAGSTGGTSLKLNIKREAVGGNAFTAGMLDTLTAGRWYPRYCRMETRMKIPHGHGLWPAWWLTAKNGGSPMCEPDMMEYFIGQLPGKVSSTLHRTNNAGTPQTSVSKANAVFETPTYTPQWQKMVIEITPENGVTTDPTTNVRFKTYLNDVKIWDYLDTQALYWTTNGGSEDQFWNVFIQGCQIDGLYIGHPDGPLGYAEELNSGTCTLGGTAPNGCNTSLGGFNIIRAGAAGSTATFGTPASTFELDYHKVWKFTG